MMSRISTFLHTPAADRFVRRPLLTGMQTLVSLLGLSATGLESVATVDVDTLSDLTNTQRLVAAVGAAAVSAGVHLVLAFYEVLQRPWASQPRR